MTSANFLRLLRDFVPEYQHPKFGSNWTTNKGETEGGGQNVVAYMVPKDPSLNRVKLPGDVKAARLVCKTAFDSWKKHDFLSGDDTHDTSRCTGKEHRLFLCNFLNNLESNKIKRLCNAAGSDGKLF